MQIKTLITTLMLSIVCLFNAHSQTYSEYEVKLVYIYQFVKYFNWPADHISANEKFTIGIYGETDLGDLPNKMYKDRKFNGKDCAINNISTINEAKTCDLVFVLGIKKFEAMQLITALKKTPVLTVGDHLDDFCEIGGMINFTDKTEKQRLELCPDNVENAKLQVSKQLYAIAKIIDVDVDVF